MWVTEDQLHCYRKWLVCACYCSLKLSVLYTRSSVEQAFSQLSVDWHLSRYNVVVVTTISIILMQASTQPAERQNQLETVNNEKAVIEIQWRQWQTVDVPCWHTDQCVISLNGREAASQELEEVLCWDHFFLQHYHVLLHMHAQTKVPSVNCNWNGKTTDRN